MMRARALRFVGEAEGHHHAQRLLKRPGDASIDRRGTERALVISCPDGCGEVLSINLDSRAGKAWRLDRRLGKFTLYPSVWRHSGCGAHFIIWRDQILWCDWHEAPEPADSILVERVFGQLIEGGGTFVHFEEIAESLNENPWDAAWACRMLVRDGLAVQKDLSLFRANPNPRRSGR